MREIAKAAEVAVGAAYYYFDSKDAIVMAFYERAQAEMRPHLEAALVESRTLGQRLKGIIDEKLAYFRENRALLSTLSSHIDPKHPLSPFSKETAAIRNEDMAFFEQAVLASKLSLPRKIAPYLPRLLWLYQMGILLFWVYDDSVDQKRTSLLFDRTLQMLLFGLKVAKLPFLRPLHTLAAELLEAIYGTS
jgi:AcrR family transcriptional regulator